MKWIGLTGGIASGKSTVSQILTSFNCPVVDADEISRSVVQVGQPGLNQVVSHFGKHLLNPDGSLNRRELGRMVFGKPDKLLELEDILHPLIKAETARRRNELEQQGVPFAFYDVPLLFEKELEKQFDAVIVVTSHDQLQKLRMKLRDQLSDEEIQDRLSSQIPLHVKAGQATWVLENNGTLEELKAAVSELVQKIQSGNA
jgi:dephospho-CoA kinase